MVDGNENTFRYISILKNLIVVNDPAERAIVLIKDINNTITPNQKKQNHVIQVREDFRKKW